MTKYERRTAGRKKQGRKTCLPWAIGLTITTAAMAIGPGQDPHGVQPMPVESAAAAVVESDMVLVNFDQTDIRTFIKTIGDITGVGFVLDSKVTGTVTVMSPTKIRLTQLYTILESVLDVQGYALVPAGDMVKVVPKADAPRHNLPVRIGSDPNAIPTDDRIVTQIMPLAYADATELAGVVQSILGADAKIAAYPRTNALVMTDTSGKIHYVAKLLCKLDVEESQDQVRVFPLKYASPEALSEQVLRILEKGASPSSAAGRFQAAVPAAATGLRVLPEPRTRALIVIGKAKDLQIAQGLIEQLDVSRPEGTNDVQVVYLRNAQAKEVAVSLTAALTNLRITGPAEGGKAIQVTADEGTNSLIIAASSQDYETVSQIIEKLDIVREQVLVEMLILEVSEDRLAQIGVDWATLDNAVADGVRYFGATNFGPRVDFINGDYQGLSVGAWKKTGEGISIGAILNLLEKQSGVNILSTPHITTSNHSKARIVVGENRPFVKDSRITETTDPVNPTVIKSYEYKDVGITLDITPHASQGGLVRLEIESEFTKLIADVTNTRSDTPTTAKRQAQTTISMQSGSTVVIGGLIRDDKVKVRKKVPLIGDLPLVGRAFRYDQDQIQKTNLLIFITPRVMETQEQMDQVSLDKRQQFNDQLEKGNRRDGTDAKDR